MTHIWFDDNDDWFERQKYVQILENHISLEAGIIPCNVVRFLEMTKDNTIDEALATMDAETSRMCRRKYRKLCRKVKKKDPKIAHSKGNVASRVFLKIRASAHEAYDEIKKSNASS
jgi:hypothetical protein